MRAGQTLTGPPRIGAARQALDRWRAAGWWNTTFGAAVVLALALIAVTGYGVLPRALMADDSVDARYMGADAVRFSPLYDVAVDRETATVRATGPTPYLVSQHASPNGPVTFVRIGLRPLRPMPSPFFLYFVPARTPGAEFHEGAKLEGVTSTSQNWTVEWQLPEPVGLWRIDVPPGAEFTLDFVEMSSTRRSWMSTAVGRATLVLGAALTLLLLAVQAMFGRFVPARHAIKTALIALLAVSHGLMTFALPPFQGPDENAHWKLALKFYRGTIASEPSAYYLPEALESSKVAFNENVRFDGEKLRVATVDEASVPPLAASHHYLLEQYPYVRLHAYPVMFGLSLLFPTVSTVQEALQFFYLARALAAVLTIALLFALHRKYELPYVVLFFFSLPLVVQQFVVVSADTLLNIGAIAAVGLFLELRQRCSWLLTAALWTIALAITASKFLVGGVLLLPLLLLPYRRIPRPALVAAAAVLFLVPASYVLGTIVLGAVRDAGQALNTLPDVERQLGLLSTASGVRAFLSTWLRWAWTTISISGWSGPLGWLDTRLSPHHLSLIRATAWLALVLDIWVYGPAVARLIRTRFGEVALFGVVMVATVLFAAFINGLLFYLLTTPVGYPVIVGAQTRHLFAAAIVALLLPLALLGRKQDADEGWASGTIVSDTLGFVMLPLLFAARDVELAIDLLTRYWA